MKLRFSIVFAALFVIVGLAKAAKIEVNQNAGEVTITQDNMKIHLIPLNDNAIRVKAGWDKGMQLDDKILYPETLAKPKFSVNETDEEFIISAKNIKAKYHKKSCALTFCDGKGKVLLQEKYNGRRLKNVTVAGVGTTDVSQTFISPADEYLYGTGQFQDGYLNIKGLTRRLTQVNTQISVPFIMSSKGYGLLWNNYGLTDFNPSTNTIQLKAFEGESHEYEVDATSTTGNRRERRVSNAFTETITVDADADYSFLLDVGQKMSRKLYLKIDNDVVVDLNNTWLPPTASAIKHLGAGQHTIYVEGVRGDKPTVSWKKVVNETTLHSPVATGVDYTVFAGNADQVVASYRHVTGESPLMPDYMLGYVHCRERFNTQDEIIENAKMFKDKNIPISVIVQDWQWWGKYGWNAMQFDEGRYPDPAKLVKDLHDMDIRFMISVWSKIDVNCEVGKQMGANGYYIAGTDWIDFFNPDAAKMYWTNFRSRMVEPYHIDAWWLDATEPENDDLAGRKIGKEQIPGEFYRNVYPMKVVNTVYNGLKETNPDEVPVILTRSGFAGLQRYNAVTWSGDVGNDMDCLRRQIAGGLNYAASGLPWWTYDAGGFFRPGNQYSDKAYQERMLRWIECSVFLPIMRVHGYMSNTEPWRYPAETEEIFVKCIKQRYELLPYIKECAKKVSEEGYTIMRPLVFDFANDTEALKQNTEYMFGPKYLVCPITEENVTTWKVYLPKNAKGWKDYNTGKQYSGGQYVDMSVTLDKIPVFERL